ncbi:MAG: Na(+)-translocating NADH:ubiquinone reductase subunit C [Bacteroidaceae bacterium]|nr:Na(+)-translocating NADH:ubiquinone reductase subunit C [Bacteroidaceae bacterium]
MAKKFKCKVCGQTFEADSMPEKCPICGAPKSEIEEVTEPSPKKKKKGFDTNGNAYTIIYASIMVILVAFLLAFVASSLKPTQDANVVNDVKNQILTSLNIESKDIEGDFNKIVKDMLIKDGELVEYDGKFQTSYSQELKDGNLHLFVATLEDGSTKYVVPMVGRGLWGGLWGYVALNDDFKTVYGTYFSHESETAGLGALIAERKFQTSFIGKKLFADDENTVALTVVKSGQAKDDINKVDGITGATLTSKGVAEMVTTGLQMYVDAYKVKASSSEVDENIPAVEDYQNIENIQKED